MANMKDMTAAIEAAAAAKTGAATTVHGHLDEEQLKNMKLEELKALAKDMDLDAKKCKTKADYVALISAEEVTTELPDGEIQDGEQLEGEGAGLDVKLETEDGQDQDADQDQDDSQNQDDGPEAADGYVLVTYTGMVNLRDMDCNVEAQIMQGTTFKAVAKLTRQGREWYVVLDQAGKQHLIAADVVRFMQE